MIRNFLLALLVLGFSSKVNAQSKAYFPLDTAGVSGFSPFVVKWYSTQLQALNEPVLFEQPVKNEIYRFTWLRTFHNPVAVRIEKHDNTYILYWKTSNGAGGYGPGKLILDKQKTLTEANWKEFTARLKAVSFWKMNATEKGMGSDGAEWILEGRNGEDYHVTSRWSPSSADSYYQCCDYLLQLTGLQFKKDEKY